MTSSLSYCLRDWAKISWNKWCIFDTSAQTVAHHWYLSLQCLVTKTLQSEILFNHTNIFNKIIWLIFVFLQVYVDGELSDRIHSPQRNTTLIYNVDPNIEHMITIFPMPNFYDNLNDPCNCATPAKYTYEPKSSSCA